MKSDLNLTSRSGNNPLMNVHVVASPSQIAKLEGAMRDQGQAGLHTWPLENSARISADVLNSASVIVVEIDVEQEGSLARIEQIRRVRPDLPIIAALEDANIRVARTLLRQGVNDVVTLPFDFHELMDQVLQLSTAKVSAETTLSPMFTVIGAQGCAGATTVLTHLAAALSDTGKRVCIVDLDLQFGDVATYLGAAPAISVLDLLEAGDRLDGDMLREAAIASEHGVHLVGAPNIIAPLEEVNIDRLLRLLTLARREFDVVLLDLPANWTNWTLSAALASSQIVLLADQSINGLRQAKRCLELFNMMDVPRDKVKLVVNRVEKRLFQTIGVHEVSETLQRDVTSTITRDKSDLASAQDRGMLLSELNRKAPFVKDIARLADELGAHRPVSE